MLLGGEWFWPWAGWLVLALLVVSGVAGLAAWRVPSQDRLVLLGFLSFLLSLIGLVGSVAWGRAGLSEFAGFSPRYATLMIPLGCWFYLLWQRCASRPWATLAQGVLFGLVCLGFARNFEVGITVGCMTQVRLQALEDDIVWPSSWSSYAMPGSVFFRTFPRPRRPKPWPLPVLCGNQQRRGGACPPWRGNNEQDRNPSGWRGVVRLGCLGGDAPDGAGLCCLQRLPASLRG
jgi:hypothetical protein